MAVNINDFARYARWTRMVYAQIHAVPLSFMLMSFMGIIIAGAASDLYETTTWDTLAIMSYWSESSGARAAAAFVSLSFVLAQLEADISANCISAVNDLNAMFHSINSSLAISKDADHLYNLGYIYGFFSSFVIFSALGLYFPARTTFTYENETDQTKIA
ncbi:hypothetical protein P171DRAFT_490956 [Karstenula rhodostoma CBS 690.94]|uniref:Uncharacterized protein n=1 Tax=Karstenula rhodostoma CBS 690.94 TaxID=1392251 RepID=A0A9P4U5C9_9PLEO|nr:hypothetical protein P171DRAFT_490956 [Karstenula rhodostoma CBS 690.94]